MVHLHQCVRLTVGAPTARTSVSVTMAVPVIESPALVYVLRATPAPHVRIGAPTARTALGVSTVACVSTGALASTTPGRARVPPDMLEPSVKQVSVSGVLTSSFLLYVCCQLDHWIFRSQESHQKALRFRFHLTFS